MCLCLVVVGACIKCICVLSVFMYSIRVGVCGKSVFVVHVSVK